MRGAVLALGLGLRCAHKTQGFSHVSDFWKCLTWLQLVFKKTTKKNPPPHSLLQGVGSQVARTSLYLVEMERVIILTTLCYD